MGFNFNQLNTIRTWAFEPDYDTSSADSYKKLEELYNENDDDTVYIVRGCFLNPKTNYKSKVTHKKEAPVIMLDEYMVNVPDHQIGAIKQILNDPEACRAIDLEQCGFTIRKYHQQEYDKECYSIQFCNVEDSDTGDGLF